MGIEDLEKWTVGECLGGVEQHESWGQDVKGLVLGVEDSGENSV